MTRHAPALRSSARAVSVLYSAYPRLPRTFATRLVDPQTARKPRRARRALPGGTQQRSGMPAPKTACSLPGGVASDPLGDLVEELGTNPSPHDGGGRPVHALRIASAALPCSCSPSSWVSRSPASIAGAGAMTCTHMVAQLLVAEWPRLPDVLKSLQNDRALWRSEVEQIVADPVAALWRAPAGAVASGPGS